MLLLKLNIQTLNFKKQMEQKQKLHVVRADYNSLVPPLEVHFCDAKIGSEDQLSRALIVLVEKAKSLKPLLNGNDFKKVEELETVLADITTLLNAREIVLALTLK